MRVKSALGIIISYFVHIYYNIIFIIKVNIF